MDAEEFIESLELDAAGALEHYGIKGMQWGVRRTKLQLRDAASEDAARASQAKSKVLKNRGSTAPLSNQELKALNERMQLEQNYSQLMAREKANAPQSNLSKGAGWVAKLGQEIVNQQIKNVANAFIKKNIDDTFGDKLKSKAQLEKEAAKRAKMN